MRIANALCFDLKDKRGGKGTRDGKAPKDGRIPFS